MAAPVVLWFRQDLRLADNPALVTANRTGAPVIAIYILHDETGSGHATGEASRWWLHHSLTALAHDLKQRDNCLLLRRGDPFDLLTSIIRSTGASELYFNCCYEPYQRKLEAEISEHLASEINIHPFASSLLFDPETIHTRMGSPFRVFTPFWKTCLNMPEPAARLGVPVRISGYGDSVESDQLADWKLLPSEPDWSTGFQKLWSPGESAAHERLDDFVRCGISHYGEDRDRPDRPGTSRLSPHLHFGEITPRQIWHKIRSDHSPNTGRTGGTAFLRELGWREFCTCLLYHWPSLVTKPFRPEFESFPWRSDAGMLARWQQGLTGYPMVDAGMRELWNTGRMHNRVRMITASFLVKDPSLTMRHAGSVPLKLTGR